MGDFKGLTDHCFGSLQPVRRLEGRGWSQESAMWVVGSGWSGPWRQGERPCHCLGEFVGWSG